MKISPTPFKTVHITATDHTSRERAVKSAITREARNLGLGERLTRRSHATGSTVTVFDIYRKA